MASFQAWTSTDGTGAAVPPGCTSRTRQNLDARLPCRLPTCRPCPGHAARTTKAARCTGTPGADEPERHGSAPGPGSRQTSHKCILPGVLDVPLEGPAAGSPAYRPNKAPLKRSPCDLSRQGQNARTGRLRAILRHTGQDRLLPGKGSLSCMQTYADYA